MKALIVVVCLFQLLSCGLNHTRTTSNILDAPDEVIRLLVTDAQMQQLRDKRAEALEEGQLFRGEKDWVPAVLVHEGVSNRVKIRLKGDLSDHWSHEKEWSFKVKMEGASNVYGMNRFALQRPVTRNFMNEWYFHKLLSHTGLIALKYDFIQVAINQDVLPVYAIEENIHANLVKRHKRPEGLLFKLDCDFYWRHDPGLASRFFGSMPTPFQAKKVRKDARLDAQLKLVKDEIENFRNGQVKTSNIFNIEMMAKYFVVVDIMGQHHASVLDNTRFYYNPSTKLIEPIGYDNQLIGDLSRQGLLGANKIIDGKYVIDKWNNTNGYWYQYLFADSAFMREYVHQLHVMSRKEYLDNFLSKTDEESAGNLNLIRQSYPDYSFTGKEVFYNNIAYIRGELANLEIDESGYVIGDLQRVYSALVNPYVNAAKKKSTDRMMAIKMALENGDASEYLALLDIIGCTNDEDALIWMKGEDHKLSHVKHQYLPVSQDLRGMLYTVGGRVTDKDTEQYVRYLQTLKTLCSSKRFSEAIKDVDWFSEYYGQLDEKGRADIDENRAFLLTYISPVKAVHAKFIGTNGPVESVVLVAQNIHKLPVEIISITIDGEIKPLVKPLLLRGYQEGQPLPSARFQVKVGGELIFTMANIGNDRLFDVDQFELNYRVIGVERQITEPIIQH